VDITYKPDARDECYEPEFDELHAFYLKMLNKAANSAVDPVGVKAEPKLSPNYRAPESLEVVA